MERRVIGSAEDGPAARLRRDGAGELLGVPEDVRRFVHAAAEAGAAVASGLMIVVKYGI